MNRPEYVKCVGTGSAETGRAWCGSNEIPFFIDPTHAALSGRKEGRLVACPECVTEIVKALRNGHET